MINVPKSLVFVGYIDIYKWQNPIGKEGGRITEPSEEKLKALEEAYEVLCKTGDHTQWVAAFEAAYGKKPVYIPQH